MPRIRFVVTGDLERTAIVPSVSSLLPEQTVDGQLVEWLRPRKVDGTTTNRLLADQPPNAGMVRLCRAMVAEAAEGEDSKPADLIIAVDDVELHNLDRIDIICAHVRSAIDTEVERRQMSLPAEQRLRKQLRDRCSFHLLCPMVEAYLFGDHAALVRAGCTADVQPALVHLDVERFESCDPSWLPWCTEVNERMAAPPISAPWWREQEHAKHYLEHLVDRNGGIYEETLGGKAGFASLAWAGVPAHQDSTPLIRSFFEDMADFFGIENPLGEGRLAPETYPERRVDRSTLTLRNL